MAGNIAPIVGEEVLFKNTHKGVSRFVGSYIFVLGSSYRIKRVGWLHRLCCWIQRLRSLQKILQQAVYTFFANLRHTAKA